jgi:hypothetical protein
MIATVETPAVKPRKLDFGRGAMTPDQKIQARTLYLVGNLGPKEISKKLGVPFRSVELLVSRAGWSKLRNANWAKAEAAIVAKVEADVAEVTQRIAVESEELTVGSLRVLRASIDAGNAKDMQMASGAARNLVDIARKCRGLDNNRLDQAAGNGSANVNLFFINHPQHTKPELNVTPKAEKPAITV